MSFCFHNSLSLRIVILLLLTLLSGCISGSYTIERPFDKKLKSITKGVTTRTDLLTALGPPATVTRSAEKMILPFGLTKTVDADAAFKTLSARNTISDKHLVYYYYYLKVPELGMPGFGMAGVVYSRQWLHSLWVLVDTESGLVLDYLKRKKDTRIEQRANYKKWLREKRMRENKTIYDSEIIDEP